MARKVVKMQDRDIQKVAGYIDRYVNQTKRDPMPTAYEAWAITRYVIWSWSILVAAGYIGHGGQEPSEQPPDGDVATL